ncbi:MAG: hypothetical protein L3J95_06610 [Thermoplasmata archaeon]|nr:hypothetical protein [Thermoplasmata archaeon]
MHRSRSARWTVRLARASLTIGAVLLMAAPILPTGGTHITLAEARSPGPAPLVGGGRLAIESQAASALGSAQRSLTQAWGFSPTSSPNCRAAVACLPPPIVALHARASPAPAIVAYEPPALVGASLAYDAADGYVVLFGGLYQSAQASGQTWEYLSGRWINITPFLGLHAPGPRWDAAMVYDGRDGYVLLFGGCNGAPLNGMCLSTFSDTWMFSSGGWKQLILGKPPPPPPGVMPPPNLLPPSPGFANTGLWDASITYDSSFRGGSVVLFGGADAPFDFPPPPPTSTTPPPTMTPSFYTWSWSLGAWTNVSTPTHPPAMYGAGLAGGLSDGTAVLFGGTNLTRLDSTLVPMQPGLLYDAGNVTGTTFNASWVLSSSGAWSLASGGLGPSARYDFSMAYDPAGPGTLLVYGGANSSGELLNDSWQWITVPGGGMGGPSSVWIRAIEPPLFFPGPRWNAAFTYDAADSDFLLFGGRSVSGSALSDLWLLGSSGWLPGNSVITPYPTGPSPRYEAAATFDDLARSAVVFGGESCGTVSCTFLGDTWSFVNGEWQRWSPSQSPSPRYGAAMAYDPLDYDVYLFGGCGAHCPLADTWVYHQISPTRVGTWTELFPAVSPPGRYFATLTFDPAVQGLVLFGGCEGALGPCPADDTWTLTGSGTWNDLALTPGESPPARFGAAAAFVPGSRLILFGGVGSSGLLTDTWTYGTLSAPSTRPVGFVSPNAGARLGWQAVATQLNPPGRVFGNLVFDAANDALILSGGCGNSGCPSLAPWYYTLVVPKPPPPNQPPPPVKGPWFAYPSRLPWDWWSAPASAYGSAAVWDPEDGPNGFMLAVGGRDATGQTMSAAFESSGFSWYGLDPVA